MSPNDVQAAAELVLYGIRQTAVPARDGGYKSLVERYLDSTAFQELVHAVARGMQLKLLDVDSEAGAILMAASTDSPFATGLGEYRASLGVESKQVQRAAFVLAQAAVASSLYPSADTIEYPDPQPPSTTVSEVCGRVIELSRRLRRQVDQDPEVADSALQEGWRHILALPNELPMSERHSPNSLKGLMQLVLNHLCEQKLLMLAKRYAGEEPFYVATPRYRILLAHNSGSILRVLHQMLESEGKGDAATEESA